MRNESKRQKTSISVTKRAFSLLIVIVVLASVVCISATVQNILFSEQGNGYSGGALQLFTRDQYTSPVIVNNATFGTYFALYNPENYASLQIVAINENSTPVVTVNANPDDTHDGTYNGYYYTVLSSYGFSTDYTNNVPLFTGGGTQTYDAAKVCIDAFISQGGGSGGDSSSGKPLNYTLPAGNIAYLEIDGSLFNGVNLATIMPELSGLSSGDPWSLSSQFYAMTDDMLTNGASVYDLNGTRIVWNKSTNASTNLFGQTDHAEWESQGPYPNKTYFVICNPFYFFDNENNSSITIVANGIKNVYVQPLKTVVQQNGNEISYITTVDGGTYEGEVTDNLGPIEWTDPNGGSTAPGTSTSNTPVTGINQFQQWLQGILQQIISVFEPAHDAITTLASAVQNFSGWLKALYIWLPSPVLNLLTSAISLAIIIGVIKVFI